MSLEKAENSHVGFKGSVKTSKYSFYDDIVEVTNMKECPYRYVSPEVIGISGRKMDVLRCGINDKHGMVHIDKVCANCKVNELELDCKHMTPRTRFYLGGKVVPYIQCTLYNTMLDNNKILCKDCKYKE